MASKNVLFSSLGVILLLSIVLIAARFVPMDQGESAGESMSNIEIDSKLSLSQGGLWESGQPATTTVSLSDTSAAGIFSDSGDNSAAAPRVRACNLTAKIISDATSPDVFRYTFTLKNIGRSTCLGINFSAYYPSSEVYVSADPLPSASNYYWRVGSLKPGISRTYTMTTKRNGDNDPGLEVCATTSSLAADICASAYNKTTIASSTPTGTVVQPPADVVTPAPGLPSVSGEYGLWLWHSAVTLSEAKMDTIITDAKLGGFNVIYITVDDWRSYEAREYHAALATFVRKAAAQGIAVDALAGAPNWAEPAYRENGYGVIDFVLAYRAQGLPLRGFQFDVEPYLLSTYEQNKAPVLTNFVEFIDVATTKLSDSSLRFGVVIPHFYDADQAWTPAISYGNQTAHTFSHLLRILNRKQNSTIIIMSYRNFFEGSNGVRQLSYPEIKESSGNSTKVIVAQEVGNVEPAYVTYYGTTASLLNTNINLISKTFATESGFGGIAIHHYDPYLLLR